MSKLTNYLRETRGEMKHVSWPTRKQAALFTILVIIISILTAFYLGLFDWIFTNILELIF